MSGYTLLGSIDLLPRCFLEAMLPIKNAKNKSGWFEDIYLTKLHSDEIYMVNSVKSLGNKGNWD